MPPKTPVGKERTAIHLHWAGWSTTDIGDHIGVSASTVQNILARNGSWAVSDTLRHTTVSDYNGLFSYPLTPKTAYWLGLIVADGSIEGRRSKHCFSITLKQDDDYLLRKLANDLGYNETKVKKRKRSGTWSDASRLKIHNRSIVEDLQHLGVRQNKSENPNPDVLPSCHLRHFVRGIFDGDGSIINGAARYWTITNQRSVLVAVKDALPVSERAYIVDQKSNCSTLKIGSREGLQRTYHWMYKTPCIHLRRKKSKFEDALSFYRVSISQANRIICDLEETSHTVSEIARRNDVPRHWAKNINNRDCFGWLR